MPDRFRDRDYDRREDREDRGNIGRRSDYSDTSKRRYGGGSFGDRSTFNRDEGYFGGNMGEGFGSGYGDYEPNRAYGHSWRDSTGYSNYDYPERRYESTERRAGFGRDAYGLGYGGDWEPEANRRRYRTEYSDYDRNERRYGPSTYGTNYSNYPSSESGFYNDQQRGQRDRSWWDRASDEVSSWFGDEEAERRREMDARRGHRGRGPKNYTRSDERIRDDINDRLSDNDFLDASEIEVTVQNGEVVLSGTVNSRSDKRLAEDLAEDVSGVKNVENRLRATEFGNRTYPESSTQNTTQTTQTQPTEADKSKGRTTSA